MPHHADDLDRAHCHQADLPADWIPTWKDVPCQDVVDHRHRGEAKSSGLEEPSAPQGDLHHAGVIGVTI